MRTCEIPDCDRRFLARGVCKKHYSELQRREAGIKPKGEAGRPCSFDGCNRTHYALGWCAAHYEQSKRGSGELKPITERRKVDHRRSNGMPKGWDRPAPKPADGPPTGTGFHQEIPMVAPLAPSLIAAAVDALARHGQLDLAEMLGIEVAA